VHVQLDGIQGRLAERLERVVGIDWNAWSISVEYAIEILANWFNIPRILGLNGGKGVRRFSENCLYLGVSCTEIAGDP